MSDKRCLACDASPVITTFAVRGYEYCRCAACGSLQLAAIPSPQELLRIYEADESWTSPKSAYLHDPRHEQRDATRRIGALRALGFGLDRVFELGPGRGHLARALAAQGSRVAVHEQHGGASEALRQEGIIATDRAAPPFPVDTILLWGVIEHLPNPVAALSMLSPSLAPEGSFGILTEDATCWMSRLAGARWCWLLPPEHVVLFSRIGLERCMARLGYRLERAQRMPTDVRAIARTLLGPGGDVLRRKFRQLRRHMYQSRAPRATWSVRMLKRLLDTKIPLISEHTLYRFVRSSVARSYTTDVASGWSSAAR